MDKKPVVLVNTKQDSLDGENLSDRDIESINTSLLGYSRKWNLQFKRLNDAGTSLVNHANILNAQTSDFNRYIGLMHENLQSMINSIRYNRH